MQQITVDRKKFQEIREAAVQPTATGNLANGAKALVEEKRQACQPKKPAKTFFKKPAQPKTATCPGCCQPKKATELKRAKSGGAPRCGYCRSRADNKTPGFDKHRITHALNEVRRGQ